MSAALNRQLLRLTALLQLEQRARRAARDELGFVMVNETASAIPYQQAVLWQWDGRGAGRVAAVSGVAVPDTRGPYLTWLARVLTAVAHDGAAGAIHPFTATDLPEALRAGWEEWLPAHALWVPLTGLHGDLPGALLLVRAEPWSDADRHVLTYLAEAYAHAWVLAQVRRPRVPWARRWSRGRIGAAAAVLGLVALGALPVRQSVLAPAEVVPRAPVLVRAPIDGVIDRFHVESNQEVRAGQPLLSLDATALTTRLKVAQKTQEVAQAEYLQAAQQAVFDPRAKARLALLQGRIEQQTAEVDYLRGLLERIEVAAPAAGIAVFADAGDWIGKPVTLGERILMLADPRAVELDIRLPVGDAVALEAGAEVAFFRNVAPDRPVRARVTSIAYRAEPTLAGGLAYRLEAAFDADQAPLRIGLEGTAKIYGETAPLAWSLLRRPLARLLQWLAP